MKSYNNFLLLFLTILYNLLCFYISNIDISILYNVFFIHSYCIRIFDLFIALFITIIIHSILYNGEDEDEDEDEYEDDYKEDEDDFNEFDNYPFPSKYEENEQDYFELKPWMYIRYI